MFNDLYEYLEASEQLHDQFDLSTINNIIHHFKGLEKLGFGNLPAIYIVDYRTRNYLSVSDAIKDVLGFEAEYFREGALPSILELLEPDDFATFSQKCFTENINFLAGIPPETHDQYLFSSSYRIKHKNRNFVPVVQKTAFLHSSNDGRPLIAMGSVASNQGRHRDGIITNTIEKNRGPFSWIPSSVVSDSVYFSHESHQLLTKREVEVLRWMGTGLNSSQIADKLHISSLTIKKHRSNILTKMGAKNSNQAIATAIHKNLI